MLLLYLQNEDIFIGCRRRKDLSFLSMVTEKMRLFSSVDFSCLLLVSSVEQDHTQPLLGLVAAGHPKSNPSCAFIFLTKVVCAPSDVAPPVVNRISPPCLPMGPGLDGLELTSVSLKNLT